MAHRPRAPPVPETPAKRRFSSTSSDCPTVGVLSRITEGSFFRVFLSCRSTVLRVAKRRGDCSAEAETLSRLSPEYVNRLIRHWSEDGFYHFEMEYCPEGNLWDWLLRNRYLRPPRARYVPEGVSQPDSSNAVAAATSLLSSPVAAAANANAPFASPSGAAESSTVPEDPFSEEFSVVNTSVVYVEDSEPDEVAFTAATIRHPLWRIELMRQVAAAIAHVHENNVIHMDIKPANILLRDGRFILCDFNIARTGEGVVDLDGDPVYMAPEILKNKCFFASDVYSLGIIYLGLCNPQRRLPSSGEQYSALRHNNFHGWRLDSIGRRMLEQDPRKRCSAADVRTHFATLAKRRER